MAAPGSYKNPSEKDCFKTCGACARCANKGDYNKCNSCSGRHDPRGFQDPDIDDYCSCTQGILRYRHKNGKLIMVRYKHNPFNAAVIETPKTEDERDWETYLGELREKLDNPTWDPIKITDKPDNGSGFKYLGEHYDY